MKTHSSYRYLFSGHYFFYFYGMVRRRYRKRYRGRNRRLRRKGRVSRYMYRRKKAFRRRRRAGGLTVSGSRESTLTASSLIPKGYDAYGSFVGVLEGGFTQWCINPLPAGGSQIPGDPYYVGGFISGDDSLWKKSIAVNPKTYPETVMITDLPVCISNRSLKNLVFCETMFDLCKQYRIVSVSCTFTVPERVEGAPNHNLYLMWSHLPKVRAADWES